LSLDRSGEGAGEDDAYDAEGELHGCDVDDGNELKLWSCCRWVFGFCVGGIGNWMLRFFSLGIDAAQVLAPVSESEHAHTGYVRVLSAFQHRRARWQCFA